MNNWRPRHEATIRSFLKYLNENSSEFVLKGGTALFMCYRLDRFSEDIDLDGINRNISSIIQGFCEKYQFTFRTAKNTDTVKRFMVHYGNVGRPLKIEVSYRKQKIDAKETAMINGILVYRLDYLSIMKANAYTGRDRIRDLYDLAFICNHYYDQLSLQSISLMRSALEYKGIEHFDLIIREQHDELIDEKKLAEDFLQMFDRLDLLYDEKENQVIDAIESGEEQEGVHIESTMRQSVKGRILDTQKAIVNEKREMEPLNKKKPFRDDLTR